jgi:hypothetical protein
MNRIAEVKYGKTMNAEMYEKIKDIASKTSTPTLSKKSNHEDMFLAGSKAIWGGSKNERNRFAALSKLVFAMSKKEKACVSVTAYVNSLFEKIDVTNEEATTLPKMFVEVRD